MRLPLFTIAAILMATSRADLPPQQVERIVDAIYIIEGGARARVPYGILSVRVSGHDEARAICRRTVVNTYTRWAKAGRPGDFLDFLGNRYCPPSVDPKGNINWRNNIRKVLKR